MVGAPLERCKNIDDILGAPHLLVGQRLRARPTNAMDGVRAPQCVVLAIPAVCGTAARRGNLTPTYTTSASERGGGVKVGSACPRCRAMASFTTKIFPDGIPSGAAAAKTPATSTARHGPYLLGSIRTTVVRHPRVVTRLPPR